MDMHMDFAYGTGILIFYRGKNCITAQRRNTRISPSCVSLDVVLRSYLEHTYICKNADQLIRYTVVRCDTINS